MSTDVSTTIRQPADEVHWLPCWLCERETRHLVLTSVDARSESLPHRDITVWSYHQTVQCQGCLSISFRENWQSTEDLEWDRESETEVASDHVTLFPNRSTDRPTLKNRYLIPREAREVYEETHKALCSGQPILSGIGIRALVEAVCRDQDAAGGNLEKKIDSLVGKGVLTRRGADYLHGTRLVGNAAAHKTKPHDEETLNAAMDVVESLLHTTYLLPRIAAKLPVPTVAPAAPSGAPPAPVPAGPPAVPGRGPTPTRSPTKKPPSSP